jgi:type I restriction enzyme R subunit
LKQGIEDGFLAPYKVIRIDFDVDIVGWRPGDGQRDKHGREIEDREYNQRDFDRVLVLEQRTELVARKVTEYLKATNRFDKTIIFCEDIDHAEHPMQTDRTLGKPFYVAFSPFSFRHGRDETVGDHNEWPV